MKKYKIVFSVPVHEKYEVVIDLIMNIFHFNPDCAIVLHYSKGFRAAESTISFDAFGQIIKKIGDVYVNPESVRTGTFDIIQAHIKNFKYVESLLDFEFVALTASNELFIKSGLYDHIHPYDCGVTYIDIDTESKWEIADLAKQDPVLNDYVRSQGWTKIMGSHVEGSFYRKEVMSEIVDRIDSFFDYNIIEISYPRDEVFYPTMLWNISQDKKLAVLNPGLYCWTPWNKTCYQWDILVKDIRRLKHDENVYSVKRIPRVQGYYTRDYIRQEGGYLSFEQELFDVPKGNMNVLSLWFKDSFHAVVAACRGYINLFKGFLLRNRFIFRLNKIKNRILKRG